MLGVMDVMDVEGLQGNVQTEQKPLRETSTKKKKKSISDRSRGVTPHVVISSWSIDLIPFEYLIDDSPSYLLCQLTEPCLISKKIQCFYINASDIPAQLD